MSKTLTTRFLAVALIAAGCARFPGGPSGGSPANPQAPEAAIPPASPILMSGTNYAMVPQPEQQKTPHHEHTTDQHQTAPAHEHHHEDSPK
jgi:hypothetical protein